MAYTRRDFLRTTLGTSALMSLGPVVPGMFVRSAMAAQSQDSGRDTVLVVIQLTGGNDGLNTVVPYGDDEYGRNRTTLRLPTGELHKIDTLLGFHPRMEAFSRLYHEGHLSIVQGVGYPNSERDHDRAMRMWHTAEPDRPACQTGWLGRVADGLWSRIRTDTTAVFVGPIARPFGLNAERAIVPRIRSAEDLMIHVSSERHASMDETVSVGEESELLRFVHEAMHDAHLMSERIGSVVESGDYPPFGLAGDLRTVARLIRADIGIRVYFVELGGGGIGGFDNHANQLGNHCALLHQLAESTAAFIGDLRRDRTLDRVLLMTFSEFGRTVKENGRRGTDHGAAGPVVLAGGKVKGGLVGAHPSLTDLEGGALRPHTDLRRVYATVLDRWLGVDSAAVLSRRFEPLDVLVER